MKLFITGLFVGMITSAGIAQNFGPEDIDFKPIPMLMPAVDDVTSPTGVRPVMLLDSDSMIPNNYVHIANFDAQCLVGNKNCKFPIKVYKIQ